MANQERNRVMAKFVELNIVEKAIAGSTDPGEIELLRLIQQFQTRPTESIPFQPTRGIKEVMERLFTEEVYTEHSFNIVLSVMYLFLRGSISFDKVNTLFPMTRKRLEGVTMEQVLFHSELIKEFIPRVYRNAFLYYEGTKKASTFYRGKKLRSEVKDIEGGGKTLSFHVLGGEEEGGEVREEEGRTKRALEEDALAEGESESKRQEI